jgi:NitT/TauT family transport system ATP-binding protein
MAVTCEGLSKTFYGPGGAVEALTPLDLSIGVNEFVCIVGPSGCGKSTLLRILGGILEPTSGTYSYGSAPRGDRPPTAMVFQDDGLFPWMDVLDNIGFGLEARGVDRASRRAAAMDLAQRIGLEAFSAAFPHQLSGGMRQRVGIARALLSDPQVLLMDEPFGALDAQTKIVMQEELLQSWEQQRREVLFVTHDLPEALRLADRVLVMSGRPARILADIRVTLPRPRGFGFDLDPALAGIRQHVWSLLEPEVRRRAQR